MSSQASNPSINLYISVRQGFVGQNTSLNRWCKENGISRQLAEAALKGMCNGPKGQALREKLVDESGIAAISKVA